MAGNKPVQVNIPDFPEPPAPPDLTPIHDRLENVEQITGDLRERVASAETSVREHLQHAQSTQEALALATSAHDLAKSALSKVEKLAREAAAVPAAVVHDLPSPDPLLDPDPNPEPEPNPEPRKSWWSRLL